MEGCRPLTRADRPPTPNWPVTHAAPTDFVDVSDHGVVTSWTWVSEPVDGQPLTHPFAFALVTLDGATTPILHAVDAGSPEVMHTGMRVQARWNDETAGSIKDFVFVPEGSVSDAAPAERPDAGFDGDCALPESDCAPPDRPDCEDAPPSLEAPAPERPPPRALPAAGVMVPVICILWLTCGASSTPPIATRRYSLANVSVPLRLPALWAPPWLAPALL